MTEVIWLSDTELFAAPYHDNMVAKARQYVIDMNLSAEDVKIVHRGDQVLVIAKREIGKRGNGTQQSATGGS